MLAELVKLYALTKEYVLKSEELDPESRCNIAVFKEQRDALDHLMRGLADVLNSSPRSDYFAVQIERARGHLFRAAYDSLDGMAVRFKLRLNEVIKGVSKDAIQAVFPDYYSRLELMDAVEMEIASRIREKAGGDQYTLEKMTAYQQQVERLHQFVNQCRAKALAIGNWEQIKAMMSGISNEAIQTVFPKFYERLSELAHVEPASTPSRTENQVGNSSLENEKADQRRIANLSEFAQECRKMLPALRDWERRNWRKLIAEKIVWVAIAALAVTIPAAYIIAKLTK